MGGRLADVEGKVQPSCVLAVCMTCVSWVVEEIVALELVAVMHHSVEVQPPCVSSLQSLWLAAL